MDFQQSNDNPRVDSEEWFVIAERIPWEYEYLAPSTSSQDVDLEEPIDLQPRIFKWVSFLFSLASQNHR